MTATILMAVILPSADHRTDPQLPNRRLTITPGRAAVAGRDLLEPVAEAAEHHVAGAPPDRPTQDHAALIEQQVLPELLRLHLGDQHHQAVVLVLGLELAEILDDGTGDRAAHAVQ